jgi:uncharacterized protein YsxB (DUF464 family)
MIEVTMHRGSFHDCRLEIKGHAAYAAGGKDIVCAAVSALLMQLQASLDRLTEDRFDVSGARGDVTVSARQLSQTGGLLMDAFMLGAREVAKEHPSHVRVGERYG